MVLGVQWGWPCVHIYIETRSLMRLAICSYIYIYWNRVSFLKELLIPSFDILYIKVTCLSVRAVSGHCPSQHGPLVFFLDGFCFLCQLNCSDLCFFFFFWWWVLFSVSVKLPRPLFFFFFWWWVLFSVSVKLSRPFFFLIYFLMGFVFCAS